MFFACQLCFKNIAFNHAKTYSNESSFDSDKNEFDSDDSDHIHRTNRRQKSTGSNLEAPPYAVKRVKSDIIVTYEL